MRIAVVGGGISGISMAHFLLARIPDPRLEVHLLEKRDSPGDCARA